MLHDYAIAEKEIDRDIAEAEAEYQQSGTLLDADTALFVLRNKHFGKERDDVYQ